MEPREVITYNLRAGADTSDRYYRDVSALAGRFLALAESRVGDVATAFRDSREVPEGLSFPEAYLDLLLMGLLLRRYSPQARALLPGAAPVLSSLSRLRQENTRLKPYADRVRGLLAPLLFRRSRDDAPAAPGLRDLDPLMRWLSAAGDYDEEVRRLRPWRAFLAAKGEAAASEAMGHAVALADSFRQFAEGSMAAYVPNAERFRARARRFGREDALLRDRSTEEYYLGMVASELLSHAFREAFLATERKAVILPPCMRAHNDDSCKAKETPHGARCAACEPACRVNEITRLGARLGFGVFIIPDDLAFSKSGEARGSLGVVGVSCVLTNYPGGWKTKRLGVPSQGILLDYCGCKFHWHKPGFPTDINAGRLLAVLGFPPDGDQAAPSASSAQRTAEA